MCISEYKASRYGQCLHSWRSRRTFWSWISFFGGNSHVRYSWHLTSSRRQWPTTKQSALKLLSRFIAYVIKRHGFIFWQVLVHRGLLWCRYLWCTCTHGLKPYKLCNTCRGTQQRLLVSSSQGDQSFLADDFMGCNSYGSTRSSLLFAYRSLPFEIGALGSLGWPLCGSTLFKTLLVHVRGSSCYSGHTCSTLTPGMLEFTCGTIY